MLTKNLYLHQKDAIEQQIKHTKCLINMWCGTGKTRTFTVDFYINNKEKNVIVFPSLGLINQYCNNYILSTEEPFKIEFQKYIFLAFCSDNDGKLKSKGKIKFTTDENKLHTFLKKKNKQIILVTYQSFDKFINICIDKNVKINNLIFDEAHHIVGDKIQNIVFNNDELDDIVDKTRYYTATPVNKNGITMYDRDDPENSDCGPLAYEYLYYQAVKDNICKSFETQISLYTQKTTYTNKYQPVFESIIRACLSGRYNYWNILTYHSFVNENEDMNENISFVKEFASQKNQRLVKKLFTRIQNEEFPETIHMYKVENVILKGVHCKTPTRHQIIKNFDKKIEGRIFILSSCGILNEGIDTKWANMGVPINPSKSIVKESQRIGRLVRIPEKGMPPAILLIPCEVDITKYSSMDTPELQDQMIRQELSECGNFNTALNVISAFKYQYDTDLFEMCLKYPNMFAPKEVKDNLAKQGLSVEDSQGNLLDNLKYVCDKEDIELDTEPLKGGNDKDILQEIAEQCGKTIEVHTQNYDEPVMYINVEAVDEEPLRLFYCEDDKTYSPITKKDKKQKIKRITTTPPKKRKQLFSVHTHPDLEVLWKIKEGSIDLNKTFCQGILDVDINWNVKKWMENYQLLNRSVKDGNGIPKYLFKTKCGVNLGIWCSSQRNNKMKDNLSADRIKLLEEIPGWYWSQDQQWMENYQLLNTSVKDGNGIPANLFKTKCGVKLGGWCSEQRKNKKKDNLSADRIKLLEEIPGWYWKQDLDQQWMENYQLLNTSVKDGNGIPANRFKTKCGVNLGMWCSVQRKNKKKDNLSADRIKLLEEIPGWYWSNWMENYQLLNTSVKDGNGIPANRFKTKCGVKLGGWCSEQRKNKMKDNLSADRIKLLEEIPGWYWIWANRIKPIKDMSKPKISKKKKSETPAQRKERVKSEISILHQKYKTMTSQNLSTYFKEHPKKWNEYHKISKANEESFLDSEIPRNKMIKYLENLPGKKKKVIVDLGCGHAEINHHFKDNKRFEFNNFDHHSANEMVLVKDIKNTELYDYSVDIGILSLAMWGSNCKDYLEEAYRILDTGGTLLIAEAYKRWNKDLDDEGNPVNRLVKLLEENNFTIIENQENKFMFIECRK